MMAVVFQKGAKVSHCETGVRITGDVDVVDKGMEVSHCVTGFDILESEGKALIRAVALRPDVQELLRQHPEFVDALNKKSSAQKPFKKYLTNGANLATIGSFLKDLIMG